MAASTRFNIGWRKVKSDSGAALCPPSRARPCALYPRCVAGSADATRKLCESVTLGGSLNSVCCSLESDQHPSLPATRSLRPRGRTSTDEGEHVHSVQYIY